ncbi:hypothetical protein APA_2437 [Pseudanabaena sp. lw0831]|nr:hypothetical protein APA_2437 [Pseudanabaena sp. lw0831]
MLTIILLIFSKVFIKLAWYEYLKFFQDQSLLFVILANEIIWLPLL